MTGTSVRLGDLDAQALFDESPDLVMAKGLDHRFLLANRAYASFVGLTQADLIGRLDTDVMRPIEFPGTALESFRALDEQVIMSGKMRTSRVSARRQGKTYVFDMHKMPLRRAGGEVYGVFTWARDMTESLRAEEALRGSEARYRLLLEHSPVSMFVHDGEKLLFANHAFGALMGAPNSEALIGYPVTKITHPDDLSKLAERIRAERDGKIVSPNASLRVCGLDGRTIPVQVLATKCVYEGRDAIQVVMTDETEAHRARAEREALETQLWHTQRLEALGTLAGGIAHDFNNMLAVIVMNAELARDDLDPPHPARPSIEEILAVAERAGSLVRGILAFSRKQPLARAPLRLAETVRDARRLLRATLPAAIGLSVEIGASDATVLADATQVHQALTNLCTNAWHAMVAERPGRISITVEATLVDATTVRAHPDLRIGSYVRVSVGDNASGMDAATVARAFDPFFTTKSVGSGTGLGLSVVHGIMQAHGGAVTVSSEPGVGSVFRLYFPVAGGLDDGAAASGAGAPPSGGARHVLLVDDEAAVLAGTRRTLERQGFRVTARSSFDAGLTALEQAEGTYDVIVTDQNMPGGSGLELASAARRLQPGLPVILVSGYLDDTVRAKAADAGVRVLLSKPFSVGEVTAAIEQAISRR